MSGRVPECALVLAAGKGSRMGSATLHKVCFRVDGVPAIVRALEVYGKCGVRQNLVVVGSLAGQVVETVGKRFPNTVFAYQKEQNGTAGALRAALEALPMLDDAADLLIVAGDRLIDPGVLKELFGLYYGNGCTLAMLALPTVKGGGAGRMILDEDGEVLAILEMADVRKKRTLAKLAALAERKRELSAVEVTEILHDNFSASDAKCAKAFPFITAGAPLSAAAIAANASEDELFFTCRRRDGSRLRLTPDEAENAPWSNTSVYLVKKRELDFVLKNLDKRNAQQEEYLSDIASVLSRRPDVSIRILRVEDNSKVLGFNNPSELLAVSAAVRGRSQAALPPLSPEIFVPVAEYLSTVRGALSGAENTPFFAELKAIYGEEPENIRGHLLSFLPLLEMAAGTLPPSTPVALIRAPGRVNVMGRHVDHQGGNCNLMTINYETLMVAAPRNDDTVNLAHLNSADFSPSSFRISELVAELPWEDWHSVVTSRKLKELIGSYGVDWSHYIKAAVLRLQKKFGSTPLSGMDLFVAGNVPMAAGLSSSSSLVVGAAEAVCAVNSLDTVPAQLVTLCGESEWFVGTRGGSADHAAVKLGEKNRVVKVRFFDFAVEKSVPFPADYVMVLCDSGIQAKKAGNARDQFNHRVSCYKVGLELLKKQFPAYAPRLAHLRDVNCANLGISLAQIYRMLLSLPENASRAELEAALDRDLSSLWNTHAEPSDGLYPVRGVVLYGLAECRRGELYADLLENGDISGIGKLMRRSHDGDRVARLAPDGLMHRYEYRCDNVSLLKLIDDLESGDPGRVIAAQLEYQPGGYRCSLPEIDRMVDVAQSVEGVVGAQLAGAGLGGCMMVFARKGAVEALRLALEERCYRPSGAIPRMLTCVPIAGSGILRVK